MILWVHDYVTVNSAELRDKFLFDVFTAICVPLV